MPRPAITKKGQHFLHSAASRTIALGDVMRMAEDEAERVFASIRWHANDGKPICPWCGCTVSYDCRRPNGASRWSCKGCGKDYSLTSGTSFAYHKLSIRDYLAATVIYVNEVKSKAHLALSRDLDIQSKTAFVLSHKLREAVGKEIAANQLGGIDKIAEIDGAYFGGYQKPANRKADRVDRRLKENQNGKKKCVVVIRERSGRSKTKVFGSEDEAMGFIQRSLGKGTTVHADESNAWNDLHGRFKTFRVNHSVEYKGQDGACTNNAESYFSRLRRCEVGIHHNISGVYLGRYAAEIAWREDYRRASNGDQFRQVINMVSITGPSRDFVGYWQRSWAA